MLGEVDGMAKVRKHAADLEKVLHIVSTNSFLPLEAKRDYMQGYKKMTLQFVASHLSGTDYTDPAVPTHLSDQILVAIMKLLNNGDIKEADPSTVEQFGGEVALINLGRAYFAMGCHPDSFATVELMAAMAALDDTLPTDASRAAVFDMLIHFVRREPMSSPRSYVALAALRDFVRYNDSNRSAAASRGAVEGLLDLLVHADVETINARACKAALEAVRFLLADERGRAAFAAHKMCVDAIKRYVGKVSLAITRPAVAVVEFLHKCTQFPRSFVERFIPHEFSDGCISTIDMNRLADLEFALTLPVVEEKLVLQAIANLGVVDADEDVELPPIARHYFPSFSTAKFWK